MAFRPAHYQLEVWQEAMRLARLIYDHSSRLPELERIGLQSQMRRAAVSIPSNIAEGAARGSRKDFARFLRTARASLMELDTQCWLCQDLHKLSFEVAIRDAIEKLFKRLNALIKAKQVKIPKPP